jgi:hypothetical protein
MTKMTTIAAAMLLAIGGFALNAGAADAAVAKGSVKGKVVKPDGTPAAGAEVRLTVRPERHAKGAAKGEAKPQAAQGEGKPAAKGKGADHESIAQGKTDASGAFDLTGVPSGNYVVVARLKGAGNARKNVTVTGTNAADVSLTLKERAAAKKGTKPAARGHAKGNQAQASAAHSHAAARS